MKVRAAAIASDPVADEAAQAQLGQGGSAVGAVLAGFFAACGSYSGVLLAPLSILVAGIGAGGRAYDGRLRQPGLGTKRPRGFVAGESVPSAARVAVPASVAAASVAYGYDGGKSLGTLVKQGIARAERAGAEARAELLSRVRSVGPGALAEQSFIRPFLRLAGPSEGGLITPSDFANVHDIDQDALVENQEGTTVMRVPWAADWTGQPFPKELGVGVVVCAVDVRGVFAAAAFFRASDGIEIEELALLAPFGAVPTLRGVPRCAPGAALPAPAAMLLRCDESGVPVELRADPSAASLDIGSPFRLSVVRNPVTRDVEVSRR